MPSFGAIAGSTCFVQVSLSSNAGETAKWQLAQYLVAKALPFSCCSPVPELQAMKMRRESGSSDFKYVQLNIDSNITRNDELQMKRLRLHLQSVIRYSSLNQILITLVLFQCFRTSLKAQIYLALRNGIMFITAYSKLGT